MLQTSAMDWARPDQRQEPGRPCGSPLLSRHISRAASKAEQSAGTLVWDANIIKHNLTGCTIVPIPFQKSWICLISIYMNNIVCSSPFTDVRRGLAFCFVVFGFQLLIAPKPSLKLARHSILDSCWWKRKKNAESISCWNATVSCRFFSFYSRIFLFL